VVNVMKKSAGFGLLLAGLTASSVALAVADTQPVEARAAVTPAGYSLDPSIFPRLPLLEPNVAFWTEVFGQYSEFQSVIHYEDQVEKIYTVLDFRDDAAQHGAAVARSRQSKAEKAVKRELDQHLRRIHTLRDSPTRLSPVQQKIFTLFADSDDPNRFRNAIGNFRSQRGLREKTERALKVSGQYLPKMEAIFAAEGLPVLLTRLPLVESSFNVDAYSKVGAAGLWQFIPSSARIYMRLDEAVDDRRDPWTSTRAAARHLKDDFAELGTWPLAITAYNHGRGGLARGLRETRGKDLDDLLRGWNGKRFGFASRNFYSEFLAAVNVERNYREHFGEIERHDPIEFDVVQIHHFVPYAALRELAGVSEKDFRMLNPGYRPEVLDGRLYVPPQTTIRVPVGKGQAFMAAYLALDASQRFDQQRFYYVRYRVQNGDNLGAIARRYGVRVADLKLANGIGTRNFIRAGQVLKIPPRGKGNVMKVAAREPAPTTSEAMTYLRHRVRPGQNLTTIAKQYRTTIEALRQLNGLDDGHHLQAGATLKVPSY
jgi:membrane-bound lytic murein transglycosylase D